MGRYWAKIAQISDFAGKLILGFIVRFLRDEGVALDGDAEPSAASGGCSEAEHPQRSKNRASEQREDFFGHRKAVGADAPAATLGAYLCAVRI